MGNAAGVPINSVLHCARSASANDPALMSPRADTSKTDEELVYYLRRSGVDTADKPTREQLELAIEAIRDPDFWRMNCVKLNHPNVKRVKNWLWVHQRYRDQCKAILALKERNEVRAAFKSFSEKISKHSQFEDEQLFKFFREQVAPSDEAMVHFLNDLDSQHNDVRDSEALQDVLNCSESTAKDWMPLLEKYQCSLLEHLQLEERTLVSPWLNLSDEDYATYRTYLSWKYAAMY